MKLYTRTGDAGETGLYGPDRVSKAHPRVEAYGTVDELNSLLGVVRAALPAGDEQYAVLDADLAYLQNVLFDLGADLATRVGGPYEARISRIDEADITALEAMIDRYQAQAPAFTGFVHPGGSMPAAQLRLARTAARRAERETVRLANTEPFNQHTQIYLNRLSDLLFIMARAVNAWAGVPEERWQVGARR